MAALVQLQTTNIAAGSSLSLDTNSLLSGALRLTAFTPPARYLRLSDAKSDLGVPLTAAAGTPSGTVGISRTAGTSMTLVGEATSSSAKTNKAVWELNLPDTYNAGVAIPVDINASISGTGTLTAASCTVTLTAYSEVNGVEAALSVTGGAQQMVPAGSDLLWTVAGTGLVPGSHVALEAAMLVTSSSGANTGAINSISFTA